jgi:urea-proton symporter
MDKSVLALTNGLTPALGFAIMIGLGIFLLILSFIIRNALVRNTHDFIIADRKVGFGFGVGSVIAVWTWAMAVMMSSAMTFQWGLSGLFWFVVPNGFAVIAMVPFARILRKNMPQGYTISEFIKHRFAQSKVASGIVTLTMIFGILLEILINLKGTSVVISTVFAIDWKVAAIVGIVCVLTYSYFGGLWTSVMTGTLNTLMVTVPAAIVVAAVFDRVHGGAPAVFDAVAAADPRNLSVLRPDAAAGFGITLAFGLLAATVADQTFWQKVWAIRGPEVARTFFWAGALFYPIPICLGMLGLVGIAFSLTPADIGGDIAAIGPYIVSHIGLPLALVILYVLAILAACYSTIDGASAALSSVVAVDIVKRYWPATKEGGSSSSPNYRCCWAALSPPRSCYRGSTSPLWC